MLRWSCKILYCPNKKSVVVNSLARQSDYSGHQQYLSAYAQRNSVMGSNEVTPHLLRSLEAIHSMTMVTYFVEFGSSKGDLFMAIRGYAPKFPSVPVQHACTCPSCTGPPGSIGLSKKHCDNPFPCSSPFVLTDNAAGIPCGKVVIVS
jgi:hypothetical protein